MSVVAPWHDEGVSQFESVTSLIGRDSELGVLDDALDDVRAGATRTVVIGGEAGIGKSRLLREFLAAHADDSQALFGQCVDLGDVAAAYTPVVPALRPLLIQLGAQRVRELTGAGAGALLALFPELRDADAPTALGPVEQFHEAVATVLEAASEDEPIVLVFEDVHWIDPASLGLLQFLTRVQTGGRVLLVFSYRSDDVGRGHPVRRLLGELERNRAAARIMLERLPHDQVRDLAEELRGAPLTEAELDGLTSRSEGVPFFVEELVAFGGDDAQVVPETLRELLLARYERLGDPAQRLARVLAVGGTEVEHVLLSRVWGADGLDDLAREALLGGVIQADHDAYRFRHALVREAILDDVLPGEHERIHARYAAEYERLAEETGRPHSAAIAHHWLQARNQERAFPATIRAAREARSALAFASAAQHGERALALWDAVPDAEAVAGMSKLAMAGRATTHLRNAGELERSLALVTAALQECEPGTVDEAMLLHNRAKALSQLARTEALDVYRQCLTAAELLDDGRDPQLAALHAAVMVSFSGRLMLAGEVEEARALALDGAALAQELGDARTASVGVNIAAVCLVSTGDADGAMTELEEARRLAGEDGPAQVRYFVNASDAAQLLGQYRHSITLAQQGVDAARRLGFERTSGVLLSSNLAEPLVALGEWDRADAIIARAMSLEPPRSYRTHLVITRATMLTWRGDPGAADALLREQRSVLASRMAAEVQSFMGVSRVAMEASLALGDVAAAWEHAAPLLEADPARLCAGRVHTCAWPIARTIAAARASGSSPAHAEPRLRALVAAVDAWPAHDVWAPIIDAELAGTADGWRAALAAARDDRAPAHVQPYVLVRLGEALIAEGARGDARDVLADAIDAAESRGVTSMRERAVELAADAGFVSAGRPRRGTGALTEREEQVLALVAEGLSNGQIGQRLFISTKTASVHVSSILRKLGASSRTEAAHLAARDAIER
ncbi:helix-turn-helix transcriptional regulator [Microbacterium halophytorum]|uniref:helix-turn-helix transcriptional regulator n=1 Tax=Microbacterium halophytorum TaxID=2067568 RepID=UPI001319F769|nr:helix-turn-helix transcriptional regulator [Microbacterium halophytorum]